MAQTNGSNEYLTGNPSVDAAFKRLQARNDDRFKVLEDTVLVQALLEQKAGARMKEHAGIIALHDVWIAEAAAREKRLDERVESRETGLIDGQVHLARAKRPGQITPAADAKGAMLSMRKEAVFSIHELWRVSFTCRTARRRLCWIGSASSGRFPRARGGRFREPGTYCNVGEQARSKPARMKKYMLAFYNQRGPSNPIDGGMIQCWPSSQAA